MDDLARLLAPLVDAGHTASAKSLPAAVPLADALGIRSISEVSVEGLWSRQRGVNLSLPLGESRSGPVSAPFPGELQHGYVVGPPDTGVGTFLQTVVCAAALSRATESTRGRARRDRVALAVAALRPPASSGGDGDRLRPGPGARGPVPRVARAGGPASADGAGGRRRQPLRRSLGAGQPGGAAAAAGRDRRRHDAPGPGAVLPRPALRAGRARPGTRGEPARGYAATRRPDRGDPGSERPAGRDAHLDHRRQHRRRRTRRRRADRGHRPLACVHRRRQPSCRRVPPRGGHRRRPARGARSGHRAARPRRRAR